MQIYSQQSWGVNDKNEDKVVCLLDHLLDGSTGLELHRNANELLKKFNVDITWVLVSSTEDIDTIRDYQNEGILY